MATYITWPAGSGGGGSTTALALKTTGADVDVSAAAPPTTNQVLTATSATTSTWQANNAVGLRTAGAAVGVSASAAPTGSGFVLVTTGATTATWQDYTTLNLVNNLRFDATSNTTNTASISSSGGGTTSEALVLGKDSTITVTGAGSANNCAVLGTDTVISATTGSIANSVFVGQGHVCASGASTTTGAIVVGSAVTVAAGATNSITLGHSITNGTPNSFLVAPGGNPSFFVPDPQYSNFFFTTRALSGITNATYTLSPDELLAGRLTFSNGSATTVTLPLGSDMDSHIALTQNLWVGMTFVCYVAKLNAGALTWTSNTGFTMQPQLVNQASTTTQSILIRRDAVNTWYAYRCG